MGGSSSKNKNSKPVIAIVYYSTYGHIATLARSVADGAEATGAIVKLYQVPETLPAEVLEKMHAPPKDRNVTVLTDPTELIEADAIIFGISTRFGTMSAQMKAFLDSTGKLWSAGQLTGKIASVFFSTATLAGGQESSALTMMPFFAHHGMMFAPIGYSNTKLFEQTLHGGSPWGAGTIAGGDGSRLPSEAELDVANTQGRMVAEYAESMKTGKAKKVRRVSWGSKTT